MTFQIPDDFKNVLLTVSSHCEFKWFLPDDFPLPEQLRQIFSGELHWGIDFILQFNESKDVWIKKVFPDINNEYDKVWHKNLFSRKLVTEIISPSTLNLITMARLYI